MKSKAASKREHAIEVVAEHERSVTLITKLSYSDAVALQRATEGILWFTLEHVGEPLNPNANCFVSKKRSVPTHENGLGIFLDFNQALIDAIAEDDREEIFLDDFIDRWDADEGDTKEHKPIPMLEPRWKAPNKKGKKRG